MSLGLTIPFTGLKKQYNNIRTEVLNATDEVLRSGQLMNGNHTVEFESWLAKKNHVRYAVTCHSGTHALEIIAGYWITQEQLPHPPTVLIPALTYTATANAFIKAGWEVHFIDTDAYGLIDLKKIPYELSYQAVVLVGLYGASVTHRVWQGFQGHWVRPNVIVIEDAAQHWLSGDCARSREGAAISFDPMKNLACYGNGGAVVTNNLDLAEYARAWRDNGKPTYYSIGTNSRMSEIDCATMLIKTKYIDEWQARRAIIANFWIDRLKGTGIRCLIDQNNAQDHCFHKFVIDVDQRDILQRNLALRKIETKIHYAQPLHEVNLYRQYPGPDMLSVASALSRRVLSLPLYPELSDLEVEFIVDTVIDCVLPGSK